jgi:hypothetical protein
MKLSLANLTLLLPASPAAAAASMAAITEGWVLILMGAIIILPAWVAVAKIGFGFALLWGTFRFGWGR